MFKLETDDMENLHPILKERDELMEEITNNIGRFDIQKKLLDKICKLNIEINRRMYFHDEVMERYKLPEIDDEE